MTGDILEKHKLKNEKAVVTDVTNIAAPASRNANDILFTSDKYIDERLYDDINTKISSQPIPKITHTDIKPIKLNEDFPIFAEISIESECLLPVDAAGFPFLRGHAPVKPPY